MAVVLDALAPYLIQTIKDMAEDELRVLLGVSSAIEKLGKRMGKMEAYLADAERRRIDEPVVQGWVNELKGAMYEATDVLDLCQLDSEERQRSAGGCCPRVEKKAPGCLQPLLFCLRDPSFARSMGKRIKALDARLDDISKEMSTFGFLKLNSYKVKTLTSEATPHSRVTTSLIDESAVVGDAIQVDTRALVQVLQADEPATILVVSIVGAGGMGKTTLAKMIFNDRDIEMTFRSKIWLSVTERYEEDKLLSSAIAQAGGAKDGNGDKQILTKTLADVLSSTGKFLLVMDDIWSELPWTDVLQSPFMEAARNQPQSRVVITTRNESLVKYMGATYHPHHVKPLGDEDAWTLLKKQLRPQAIGSVSDIDHLKHIGMRIIRKCDGLPLSIKAVGGLLKTKKENKNDWMGVLDAPAWSIDKTHHDLNSALLLSYEDLSPPLKQCFLYSSLFPKSKNIHMKNIVSMWMSEGLLHVSRDDRVRWKETEEIGLDYYRDLIARNLIESDVTEFLDGSVARMHDVVRSFAQHMAKEEALVIQRGQLSPQLASSKFRRLSIESVESESSSVALPDWSNISGKQELLRTLIIHGRIKFEPRDSSLSIFPSLRALYVSHAEMDRFVDSLPKLKHIRFLRLIGTDISRLPDDIDNMKFLEYIRLEGCSNFHGHLPRSILKLEHLRHLSLIDTNFTIPKGVGGLENLRTLQEFSVQVDGEWCSLQELGTLSHLRDLALLGLEAVPDASLAAEAKLHNKEQLRNLWVTVGKKIVVAKPADVEWEAADCQRVEEVFDQLCPPCHLEGLCVYSYIGRRPPRWMCMYGAVDLDSLASLELINLPFCTQLPNGLRRLPNLDTIIIRIAPAIKYVSPEFQQQTDNTFAVSFPRLQWLCLDRFSNWDKWDWEDVEAMEEAMSMPDLKTLLINNCKLYYLPPGLASSKRRALKRLRLRGLGNVSSVNNFPSVVELELLNCPKLKKINGFFLVQKITIVHCPNLEVIEGVRVLDILVLEDATMETLPGYLRSVNPRYFYLRCNKKLCEYLVPGTNEWDKICHITTHYIKII
ncbi:hypothetical protein U9M48_001641 [Paspalum notatum var. saurae]|uniref:Uncharacterized protein n=1 Tax=Paspalum notatum var. saurae TaxID=547442 RepID=A0AAQ3PMC2_PASNO